ncbi:MAG: PCRF domain-containing protein, partial [Treponema sp.]|nr:PCRF domain-containing protein [Treponema sp.]
MDLLKKLDELDARLKVVSEIVQDPDLVKDKKKYKETMSEFGHLNEVTELGKEYRKILQGIEDSKMMITAEDDPEMKEMAR